MAGSAAPCLNTCSGFPLRSATTFAFHGTHLLSPPEVSQNWTSSILCMVTSGPSAWFHTVLYPFPMFFNLKLILHQNNRTILQQYLLLNAEQNEVQDSKWNTEGGTDDKQGMNPHLKTYYVLPFMYSTFIIQHRICLPFALARLSEVELWSWWLFWICFLSWLINMLSLIPPSYLTRRISQLVKVAHQTAILIQELRSNSYHDSTNHIWIVRGQMQESS